MLSQQWDAVASGSTMLLQTTNAAPRDLAAVSCLRLWVEIFSYGCFVRVVEYARREA